MYGATSLPPPDFDLRQIERARVLRLADRALEQAPLPLTSLRAPRSPGSPHDYYSEGDYWWPNPNDPTGPYIQRDGYSNPEKFVAHRDALIRLSLLVPALTAAWRLTGEPRYASHAVQHLAAWFVTAESRMNPRLDYAQAIVGRNRGRGIGIIDTLHLVEVARAAELLRSAGAKIYPVDTQAAVADWFGQYLHWLNTSENAKAEKAEKNNHGSCWLLQCLQFAQLSGAREWRNTARERFTQVLLPQQIDRAGRQPLELARTKPYSYSLFNIDVLSTIAHILSQDGENLFLYQTADGCSLKQAVAYMYPYIADKAAWPYPADVEYFDQLPVRQVHLLFAGQALSQPQYLALWRKLDPDPQTGEIIRNFPIRQPLLWFA